jgi:CBS domain-containing protein
VLAKPNCGDSACIITVRKGSFGPSSLSQALGRKHLGDDAMTIEIILQHNASHDLVSCECDEPVYEVVKRLAEKRIGAMPVLRDGQVQGIFSERDLVYRIASDGDTVLKQPVKEVMTAPAVTITSGTSILAALSLMTRRRIRHLPVVDDGALKGFVSIGDLVKYRIEMIEQEAAAMRDYIAQGSNMA